MGGHKGRAIGDVVWDDFVEISHSEKFGGISRKLQQIWRRRKHIPWF